MEQGTKAISMTHKQPSVKQPSVFDFFERFPTEESARNYLINARWPDGVTCPHCGHDEIYRIRDGNLFRCKDKKCSRQFTLRIGTVMQETRIPLQKWLFAMYMFGIHPKGLSSIQLSKMLGVAQNSVWHLEHRMRTAFADNGIVLDGVIEADEMYLGPRERNKHASKKLRAGRGPVGKQPIIGLVQRGGTGVAFPIDTTAAYRVSGIVNERVAAGSRVYTDESRSYSRVKHKHETVNHTLGEYVRGEVHTNSIEGRWSLVRRMHYGVHHSWAPKNTHRYTGEIFGRMDIRQFPAFDDGDGSNITMIRCMMAGFVGKRLTWKELTRA